MYQGHGNISNRALSIKTKQLFRWKEQETWPSKILSVYFDFLLLCVQTTFLHHLVCTKQGLVLEVALYEITHGMT